MHKYTLALLIWAALLTSLSGQNAVEKFFTKYSQDESFRTINLSGTTFKLMAKSDKMDSNPELAEVIQNLDLMRVLSKESDGQALYQEALPSIRQDFEHIMTINEDGEFVEMFIREGENHIEQFVAVANRASTFALIDLHGVIDLQTIGRLGETLDAPALDYLSRLKEK